MIFSGLVDRLVLTHAGQHISILSVLGSAIILLSAYFGTFAKTVPAVLFSPLPMPASSPKVPSLGSFYRERERRDSLSNKRSPPGRLGSLTQTSSRLNGLLSPAMKVWHSATATLTPSSPSSHPLSQPLDADRIPRRPAGTPARLGLFAPTPSPVGAQLRQNSSSALELDFVPEKRERRLRPIGGGSEGSVNWYSRASAPAPTSPAPRSNGSRSGRQSPRSELEPIDSAPDALAEGGGAPQVVLL